MITPPTGITCLMSAHLHKDATISLFKDILPLEAISDLDSSWIFSNDIANDIEAYHLTEKFIKQIQTKLPVDSEFQAKFNPVYLPVANITESDIDFDAEGEIIGLGGFSNPYCIFEITLSLDEDTLVKVKVIYEEFDLPELSIESILNGSKNETKIN